LLSLMPQGRLYSLKQRLFPAGFVQKSHRTGGQRPRPRVVVSMRGDKNDRDPRVVRHQVTLKIQPAHAGHPHIENQARRLVQLTRIEELFGRREIREPISDGSQQVVEGIPQRVVIVDNRYERSSGHAVVFPFLRSLQKNAVSDKYCNALEKSSIRL
jgi:hypothetical protein